MMTTEIHKISLKKDDSVQVIAGREKGKIGKILSIDAKQNRIIVDKVNMVKRHVKPSQKYPQGGILDKETGIHYSNILLMCPKCNKGVRHGHKFIEAGAKAAKTKAKAGAKKEASEATAKLVKVRVCKKCGTQLDAGRT